MQNFGSFIEQEEVEYATSVDVIPPHQLEH